MFISKGNKKVKALIFNLPCGVTCKPGLQCAKYCYAKKAERQYKQVKPCRLNNWRESKKADFVDKIVAEISKSKQKIFRIHESGDFYSRLYIAK